MNTNIIKHIIEQWCNTDQLSHDDAVILLKEYFSIDNRKIDDQLIELFLSINHIDWSYIINILCYTHNLQLLEIFSPVNEFGQHQLISRQLY